jgi:2,4-dienoyl-CoA reductase-like NADH-dependent reductase (Old Yellow Enzyme family)
VRERFGAAAAADDDSCGDNSPPATTRRLRTLLRPREFRDLAFGFREEVNDLHQPHLRELPRVLPGLFADAAARAEAAGFDGVELHYAHAYTMASFLSRTNVRTDGYGGSPEARLRLPLEVFAAVRARTKPRFCVGARFLGDEVIERRQSHRGRLRSMRKRSRAPASTSCRSARAASSTTRSSRTSARPRTPTQAPPATSACQPCAATRRPVRSQRATRRGDPQRRARHGHTTPIVTAGGICDFAQAEAILQRGDADFIAAARQSLADPDWWEKMRQGRGAEVRRCKFTNYCEGLDQKHKEVTCQLWDRDFATPDAATVPRSADGKRRLLPPRWQ